MSDLRIIKKTAVTPKEGRKVVGEREKFSYMMAE